MGLAQALFDKFNEPDYVRIVKTFYKISAYLNNNFLP